MWESNIMDIEIDGVVYQVLYNAKVYLVPSEFGIKRAKGQKTGRISKLSVTLIDPETPYKPDEYEKRVQKREEECGYELDDLELSLMLTDGLKAARQLLLYDRGWDMRPTDAIGKEALRILLTVFG